MRLLLIVAMLLLPMTARAQELTMLAAASLTDALQDVAAIWTAGPGKGAPAPRFSFGPSSTLARQIEQGAPANLFASADERWMDYLDQRGLLAPSTRRNLLTNDLVLVVPVTHPQHVEIGPGLDLAALLGPGGRIATGDPAHVPVGLYAQQALTKLGLWSSVEARIAPAADVRSALLQVARGEAPVGIVYSTDAKSTDQVMVAGVFPADSHEPIVYPFAIVRQNDTPQARDFLTFLEGPEARAAFVKRGFGVE